MKDTFTLWGVQDLASDQVVGFFASRSTARRFVGLNSDYRVVKLECRIVQPQRKPKRGKYPNDNYGLPAGYTPHNPDNLAREQVGEGFRLLATVEIWERPGLSNNIRAWAGIRWGSNDYAGAWTALTYRVPINTPLDINPELKTK